MEVNERTHYGNTLDLYLLKGLISISDQIGILVKLEPARVRQG